jgi:acetyl-CoA acetyltransferase
MQDVVIAGVGIHPFGRFPYGYRELGEFAARDCLADAGVAASEIDHVFVANVGAEMAKGHNIIDRVARIGVPIINIEAACASSGSALYLAAKLIEGGGADVVLCLGVEKAPKGFIGASGFDAWQIENGLGVNPVYFAIQAQELIDATDVTVDDLAEVSVKNHRHAIDNPNAMFRKPVSREDVLGSRAICPPLTLLMLCAPNEGAAAVLLMSRRAAQRRGLTDAVRLTGLGLVSRGPDDWFVPASSYSSQRSSLTTRAAGIALADAGIGIGDVDVVECQDTDVASELIAYSDLGLCAPGDEVALLRSGATTFGGRIPVNVSGGLLSKGEPLGASGLGQVHELVQQVRGRCGPRQIDAARIGLGHVMGAGHNSCVVVVER